MATNFKCKADDNGYCRQWLRSCVGWENCNLKGYGAPCQDAQRHLRLKISNAEIVTICHGKEIII